jgi:hypothetical protein
MQILQLNPPIYVITPKGEALARLVIDYGTDINTIWVVDLMDSRKCIHVDSDEIRFGENLMWNLKQPEIPRRTDET